MQFRTCVGVVDLSESSRRIKEYYSQDNIIACNWKYVTHGGGGGCQWRWWQRW
jgi:RES domain-containing protein